MSFDLKRLYELLPALYRIRDTELGLRMLPPEERRRIENLAGSLDEHVHGPLRSLLSIIAEQVAVLEENLDQLYDDQFIETCAEWAVSYIGELVGARPLIPIPGSPASQRAEVANTIAYRRRKGTASVIEQLARDVTGWNANVVEYFQLLATTQYMNHLRPKNLSFSGIRDWQPLEHASSPFDVMAHTADVRRIEKKRGKYNIQNIGVYLWRLNSYSLTRSPAYKVDGRRYTFDPLGKSRQLYNFPVTEDEIAHLAEPANVPMPISRRSLHHDLEAYYGKGKSILIYIDGQEPLLGEASFPDSPISPDLRSLLSACDLSDILDDGGNPTGWAHMPQDKIAIDPVLGRIAFPADQPPPESVHVTFYYGFSADMGGGEYGRAAAPEENPEQVIEVSSGNGTIQEALDELADTGGIVEVLDNEYYFETPVIRVAQGKAIELRAANKSRPILVMDGEMLIEAEENAKVILNGFLISGGRIRLPLMNSSGAVNRLQALEIRHCTLLPGPSPAVGMVPAMLNEPRLVVESPGTTVRIEKSITGELRVFEGSKAYICDSIVDAADESATAYAGLSGDGPGGVLNIENSTVIGKVNTRIMELASNSIFLAGGNVPEAWPALVMAQRLQEGCVRFSYFPPGSRLPRAYRCQPARPADAARVRPTFTSLAYGDAGYGQLSSHCAAEITQGADDEAEMGAFHGLYQPQRVSNLRTRLDEYLRFGLEAGIFYAS